MGITAILGIVFVLLAFTSTYLMFRFWGYEYDEVAKKSACPQWKHNLHRGVGYAYLIIYLIMMWHMVPRLWQYHIEFPPRTVAHIMLGLTIGVILLVKISILRWFRHFEEWMPVLGVALLLCSVLLVSLSLPAALRVSGGVGRDAFADANRARTRGLLGTVDFPAGTDLDALASEASLREGRGVLLEKCTFCHDLQTAIARPRTPLDWRHTVERMADKPTLGPVLDEDDTHLVIAYLVAITPDLQQSARAKRADQEERDQSMRALEEMEGGADDDGDEPTVGDAGPPQDGGPIAFVPPSDSAKPEAAKPETAKPETAKPETAKPVEPTKKTERAVDPKVAKAAFDRICSQCHPASDTDETPPHSRRAIDKLIARMIDNGLEAKSADLRLVRAYLQATYVGK